MTNPRIEFAPLDLFSPVKSAPDSFAGATSGSRGDKDTASGVTTLYTVTGDVLVRIWGVCTADLTEAASTAKIEVGIAGNTALLIAQTTATGIDENEAWLDASPSYGDTLANVQGPFVIPNGLDIIETTSAQDINSGQVYYICLWRPLSPDGDVIAA